MSEVPLQGLALGGRFRPVSDEAGGLGRAGSGRFGAPRKYLMVRI